jgi:hypothetical protein
MINLNKAIWIVTKMSQLIHDRHADILFDQQTEQSADDKFVNRIDDAFRYRYTPNMIDNTIFCHQVSTKQVSSRQWTTRNLK